MKRYWKIILICFVTLMVIGTFYIQSSFATNDHLKIEFEKVNGNEGEVKNLMLYGDYFGSHHLYQRYLYKLQVKKQSIQIIYHFYNN